LNKLLAGLGVGALLLVISSVMTVLSTILGALSGWVVGFFYQDTMLDVFSQVGIHDVALWQIGAFLGFVGSFFGASISKANAS
jgi:hypothetical protein